MNLSNLTDELITITTSMVDTWNGCEVVGCVPILSCTKLSYQVVYIENSIIKLAPTCKINLFKKGFKGYNHIYKQITGNKPLTKKEMYNCHKRTKQIIYDLVSTGLYGKAVVGVKAKELVLRYGYKPFVEWTPHGIVTVKHPTIYDVSQDITDFL